MASNGAGAARGMFRQSKCHHPETTDAETTDSAADVDKNKDCPPLSERSVEEMYGAGK